MAAGEVGNKRREGEKVEENETRRVKRRKLECDRASSVSCCSSNNNRSEDKPKLSMEDDSGEFDQTEPSWVYDNFDKRIIEESVNVGSGESMEMEEVESRRMEKNKKKKCETVKEAELEDFFQAAEKDLRDKMVECSRKYSFDFEKDEPLDGRYEWVTLNP